MNKIIKAYIVFMIFCIVAAIMAPPDAISQLTLAVFMAIIYGILWFIVSRFKSYTQTPESIKKLIIVLICLLSITITSSIFFFQGICGLKKSYRQLEIEHSESPAATTQQQTQTQSQ